MSRLRPPVGIRVLFLAVLIIVVGFLGANAFAGEKLLLAHTHDAAAAGKYRTTVIAEGGAADVSINLTDVVLPAPFRIPAGAAVVADDAGEAALSDFVLIDVPVGVKLRSSISYVNTSTGADSSFTLDPFGSFGADLSKPIGPIQSTESVWTWLTMFVREPTPVRVEVQNGAHVPIAVEYVDAVAGLNHYRLQTSVPIGYLVVSIDGPAPWHCFPRKCESYPVVYGFGITSRANNGNARVFPFGGTP